MSGSVNKGRLEPCKNTLSGVKNVYLWKWKSYNLSQIKGVRGVSLTAYPNTAIFKYPTVSDANTYDENLGEDNAYNQSLSVTLKKIDLESNQDLSNYQNLVLGVIVEDYNGLFRLMGAFNGVDLTDLNVGVGSGRGDFNGYKLTLEAQERFKAPLFTDLNAVGFYIADNIESSSFISYWKFNGNANDSIGTNNGTSTNVSYATGLIGDAVDFNGTTSKIVIPDSDTLSFGNGTSDVDFSTIFLIKFDDLSNNPRLAIKIKSDGTNFEYFFIPVSSIYITALIDNSTNGRISTTNDNALSINNWYVLTSTYKASTKELKVYFDNSLINTDVSVAGYVAMENGTADIAIGHDPRNFVNENTLNGQINAFAFLNIELTPEQVAYAVSKYKTDKQHLI
jgi:hypothetical protein